MVPCSRAVLVIRLITSSPDTESSEPVGSSANSTCGPVTMPRASATRCACPPDSSPDRRRPSPSRPSLPNQALASASAAARRAPPSSSGRATFSSAVSSGTSCPDWNTNPNRSRRSSLRWDSRRVSSRCPVNQTSPWSGVRMPARQCSSVDLPDPLGPITATISPAPAASEAPRSAGVWPNDLTTPRASMTVAGLAATATSPWPAPDASLGLGARPPVTGAPPGRAGPAGPRCDPSTAGPPPGGTGRGRPAGCPSGRLAPSGR